DRDVLNQLVFFFAVLQTDDDLRAVFNLRGELEPKVVEIPGIVQVGLDRSRGLVRRLRHGLAVGVDGYVDLLIGIRIPRSLARTEIEAELVAGIVGVAVEAYLWSFIADDLQATILR